MPRLTNRDFLIQRTFLKDIWNESQGLYSFLPYNDQLLLHKFYGPSKDWTDEEAIAHRQTITKQHPSLPQRAGKLQTRLHQHIQAYERHLAEIQAHPPVITKTKRIPKEQRITTVRAVARPEPDLHRFARALLDLAKQMQAGKDSAGGEEKAA